MPVKRSMLLSLVIMFTVLALNAEEYKGLIIQNTLSGKKTVLLGSEDSYLFSDPDSPAMAINDKTNPTSGIHNITSFSNEFIIQEKPCRLSDFDRISGEGIYLLAVGMYFNSLSPEAAILKFPDSNNLFGDPDIVWLELKIPAERLRIDSTGNIYLLGILDSDYQRITEQALPGDCPLLHKFTPDGTHMYSTLLRNIDPAPDRYSATYTGPVIAPSNFAVSPGGETWILWNGVDIDSTDVSSNAPDSILFNIDPEGAVTEADPAPPESGYILTGLIKNTDSSGVLFEWKNTASKTETDTILTTPEGVIVVKGKFPGRVMSVNDELILTRIKETGTGIDRYELNLYSYN